MLGREVRVHRQLNIWCSYLLSAFICEAQSILALLQTAFFCVIWSCRLRMSLHYFIKSESWYLCTGQGNDKVKASAGKALLWLDDLLSQLKEGKPAFSSPKPALQHMLNSIIVQENAQAHTWFKTHAWFTLTSIHSKWRTTHDVWTLTLLKMTHDLSVEHMIKDFPKSEPWSEI